MFEKPPLRNKYAPVFIVGLAATLISFFTRLALILVFGTNMHLSVSFVVSLFIGLLYDVVVSSFIVVPFILQVAFTNNFIYSKKGSVVAVVFFSGLLYLLFFTNSFPRDFNKDLYKGVEIYVGLRFFIFIFLYFKSPEFRNRWRAAVLKIFVSVTLFLLLFNAVSEFVFWQEFSGRYNFIAVDYLIYTHEVIGNIRESYPVSGIMISVTLIAVFALLVFKKYINASVIVVWSRSKRFIYALYFLLVPVLMNIIVKPAWLDFSSNNYANELAGNGIYQFVQAFKNNELDFYRYYRTIPDSIAFRIVRKELDINSDHVFSENHFNTERRISSELPEQKLNVVLISVESLSADYMKAFGNEDDLTPYLDSLAKHCLFFTNTYASGTRTVRGLEALSLSIPPTPGQSIVKRPDNENLFSLGSVFRSKGYTTQFIYGGYGYFDNMSYFFSHNGYEVIDRSAIKPADIHYSNIWGVADEDLFSLSLRTMDDNYKIGKPFFSHIMTVSNHRPFTYPDGRIDIPSSHHSREGGVKYTDYAIGRFIQEASSKPWFANTVFVIVADHCASSAGSAFLPVTGYHIPFMIYSPTIRTPRKVDLMTAQIDIPPTILGLLHFDYESKFFGKDILSKMDPGNRAFISTYQGLGLIMNDNLVVQSPVKKVDTYKPDFKTGSAIKISPIDSLEQKAIAFYQVAAWLVKNRQYTGDK